MNKPIFYLLTSLVIISCKPVNQNIQIAQSGKSNYRIIYSDNASAELISAVQSFKESLKLMTGVDIPAFSDIVGKTEEEILIGKSTRTTGIDGSIPYAELGSNGYFAGVRGKKWLITGNNPTAINDGLYDILSRLGCVKLVENMTQYESKPSLTILPHDIKHVPDFVYRQVINPHASSDGYRQWNHINVDNKNDWGTWEYSTERIFPTESYYKSNPNFFAKINGSPVSNQINFSSSEMATALDKNLEVWSMAKGRAPYWSISPYANHIVSEDELTTKTIKETGSAAGALVKLVNTLSEKNKNRTHVIWLDGPYRKAPNNITVAENIMVVLDTKDVNNAASLGESIYNESFRTDLAGWKKLTKNIAVVSHVTNEKHYLMPYPCLNALKASLQYLKKEGVNKIIFNGVSGPASPQANLNFYVASQLAWDIDQNVDTLIKRFCDNYYGKASGSMTGFFQGLEKAVQNSRSPLYYDQSPAQSFRSWLVPNNINQLYSYFNSTTVYTQGNSDLNEKIQRDRLSLIYTQLEVARSMGSKTFGFFMNLGALKATLVRQDKPVGKTGDGNEEFAGLKNTEFKPIQGMKDLIDKFVTDCELYGIKVIDNKGTTPAAFRDLLAKYLSQSLQSHAGFNRGQILINSPVDAHYGDGDGSILNDGVGGIIESPQSNWLGIKGGNGEITWDLGNDTTVSSLSMRLLQNENARAYLPTSVSISVSSDGTNFKDAGTKSVNSASGNKIETLFFTIGKSKIKVIKIKTKGIEKCPGKNIYAGSDAAILIDELILR